MHSTVHRGGPDVRGLQATFIIFLLLQPIVKLQYVEKSVLITLSIMGYSLLLSLS